MYQLPLISLETFAPYIAHAPTNPLDLGSNLIGREKMAWFSFFFLGLTSFPKPCVNIGAKNYMAYIKERREY